ncbi:hypothetical protein EG329_005279 [Mollisiaceae sp. DMI_Dod_QoI]|nr:hypothetical protein EG329_005279 [Helotiales sp. DMI_Dod_QoI]
MLSLAAICEGNFWRLGPHTFWTSSLNDDENTEPANTQRHQGTGENKKTRSGNGNAGDLYSTSSIRTECGFLQCVYSFPISRSTSLEDTDSIQPTQEAETWVDLHGVVKPPRVPIKPDPQPIAPPNETSKSTARNPSGTKESRGKGHSARKWRKPTIRHKPNSSGRSSQSCVQNECPWAAYWNHITELRTSSGHTIASTELGVLAGEMVMGSMMAQ